MSADLTVPPLPVVAWMMKTGHETGLKETLAAEYQALEFGGRKMWSPLVRKADAEAVIASLQARLEAAERAMTALLPGPYYMDPPDGGSVTVLEQLQRMAKDAARYRWLREQHTYDGSGYCCDVSGWFVMAGREPVPCDPGALDAEIDAATQEQPAAPSEGSQG